MKTNYFVTVNNKKHKYSLEKMGCSTYFECPDANIAQEFLNEDIPGVLLDLPNLIIAEKEYKSNNDEVIRFRVSSDDKRKIEKKALSLGYNNVSTFLRKVALD